MVSFWQLVRGFCVKMKKSLFLASLAFVSANASGMLTSLSSSPKHHNMEELSFPAPQAVGNSRQPTRKSERLRLKRAKQRNLQKALTSSNTEKKSLEDFLQQNMESEESILQQTSPEKLEKIRAYLRQRKSGRNYSLDLLREAMVHYCLHTETSIEDIAENFGIYYPSFCSYVSEAKISRTPVHKLTEEQINRALAERREKKVFVQSAKNNGISPSTLQRRAKEQGEAPLHKKIDKEKILKWYKNGKTFENFYKLITSRECNTKTRFAEIISEKMTDAQKMQLVERNMDVIKDYREKLLTDKGRLDKYKDREIQVGDLCTRKFGECEDYLIRNMAIKLGYDLSKIPMEWNISYKSSKDVPEHMKQSVIKEFNEGLLTHNGIAKKYAVEMQAVKNILKRKYGNKVQRRRAMLGVYKCADLSKVTEKELHENFGYTRDTAKGLKERLNQYNKLNPNQKKLFKDILQSPNRRMPSNEDLDKIKSLGCGHNRVNEKFRKLLLILCNREDEINMSQNSIHRLKQELKTWIWRASEEVVFTQLETFSFAP